MKHLFFALGALLAMAAGAQDPSLVLADGGLQFPDGTVQLSAAVAGSAPVEDTGQQFCYDPTGATTDEIPCAMTGQDGEKQAGVVWPTPRFKDNGDGTVADNLTGLAWLKDADCPGVGKNWQEAFTWVAAFNGGSTACTDYAAGTFTDWRLPNVRELQSLLHYGVWDPAISNATGTGKWSEGDPFSGVQSSMPYWSSSSYVKDPTLAWFVYLENGIAGANPKAGSFYVWPVRGGQ